MSADYLFQPDKHYDVRYDTGDKTIQVRILEKLHILDTSFLRI